MIYRIHPNFYRYATYHLDNDDVFKKLGVCSIFGIDIDAGSYADRWQPIRFHFENALVGGPLMPIPDIIADYGRIFFNKKSYAIFYDMLEEHGEFLPIYTGDIHGYIFNPLKMAEQFNGVDYKKSTKNDYHYLTSLTFIHENIAHLPIFKCEYDNYLGVYCQQDFKDAIGHHNLRGVVFEDDIALSFPSDAARKAAH